MVKNPELENPSVPAQSRVRLARFIALWNFFPLDRWPARLAIALFILAACFARAYIGLWGMRIYTHDAFVLLDGAWRILNGQRPHVDFYTGLGPVSYLITAAGVIAARGNAAGLAYGQALFAGLAGWWAYRLAVRRIRGLGAVLLCASIALMAIVPTTIGDAASWITAGMTYNRFGYALVALLMIEACAPMRLQERGDDLRGGLSSGLILGILLFLKISFFLGGLFLLAALTPLRAQTPERWRGIGLAFGLGALGFGAYLRFDLAAMYNDLRTVAHAKHLTTGTYLVKDVIVSAIPFLLFVLLGAHSAVSPWERNAIRFAGLCVCATGFFLLLTSWQFYGLPLDAIMAVLLVDRAIPESPPPLAARAPRLFALLFGIFIAVAYVVPEIQGLNYGLRQKIRQTPHTNFTAAHLAGSNSTTDHDYVEFVNEGCEMIDRYRGPGDTVASLDFTNPFSFGLGMKPPLGGTTWLQYGTDFDEFGPSPERVFQGASLVMLPKVFSDPTLPATVPRIYEPYLKQHYTVAAESLNWRLYRRK